MLFLGICSFLAISCTSDKDGKDFVKCVLKQGILERAAMNIKEEPVTVTAFIAERSAGDIHDFYPDNFVAHRHAMIRFSSIVGNLTSAYLLTQDKEYVDVILAHVRAWFVNESTKMNPNLQYAQAIKGIATGRGIGIIDTVHLMEVAQSLWQLEKLGVLSKDDIKSTKQWFADYLKWMFTHQYGIDEMNAKNNHGTCWVMQAAVFARYFVSGVIKKYFYLSRWRKTVVFRWRQHVRNLMVILYLIWMPWQQYARRFRIRMIIYGLIRQREVRIWRRVLILSIPMSLIKKAGFIRKM